MLKVFNCVTTEHDLGLVGLAAIICVLGCFTTVTLMARANAAKRHTSLIWLVAAVLVFSFSVWSLHFVAMIAFLPARSVGYQIEGTVLSLGIVCAFTLMAGLFRRLRQPGRITNLASGITVGAGVAGMHYAGVSAMRFSGIKIFDTWEVAASVGLVMTFASIALFRGGNLRRLGQRMEAAGWFAVAICSLHFTGMAALALTPGEAESGNGIVLASSSFALVVGAVSVVLLLAFLISLVVNQHLNDRVVREYARMRLLSNLAHEALLIVRNDRIAEINSAGERLFETAAAQLIGEPLDTLLAPASKLAIERRSLCPPSGRMPEEVTVLTASGRNVVVELSCQPIDYLGHSATAIAMRDLTDSKRDQARILYLARHDTVTGLPNRYNLQEHLESALLSATHDPAALALLYIDLDHFKAVNDIYGHAAGDIVLKQAAERMSREMQQLDVLARVGGDEFVMILQVDAPIERSAHLAERLLNSMREPFSFNGNQIEIGASIGIALYPVDGNNSAAILHAADTAMYRAKEEGRNTIRYFEPAMDAQVQARRKIEEELRKALPNNELFLVYQPIIDCRTGDIRSFEALLRWRHPVRGLVSPGEFIPVAEATGLITPIGEWVIEEACREAASWPEPWRVSINVSPIQIRQTDVCAIIARSIERHGIEAGRVIVEITESALMQNAAKAVATIMKLREISVSLALDDFGTGYSSLSYLQRFKFDKLKIDKSFVDKIAESTEALSITRAITTLGHSLGLDVVAEGVETEDQLGILRTLSCDQVQGYLLGRPRAVTDLTELEIARMRSLFVKTPDRLLA